MYQEREFRIVSDMKPLGDQPQAIDKLATGVERGDPYQILLGVTGSGKTFTMANVVERVNKPTLVLSHNKTLAAQLYEEFKELFPDNAVSYFVSYYDYYQPEAYIPQRDIYIEKDASRNDDLDRLRMHATAALMSRSDVLIVASVSCIFGLGSPDEFKRSIISLTVGQLIDRQELLKTLTDLQYTRGDFDFKRGTFRVRGDVIELHQASQEFAYRIEMFGDEIDSLALIDPLTGELVAEEKSIFIYPAVLYVIDPDSKERAIESIREELEKQHMKLRSEGKLLEAQRLMARTKYDIEMIEEVGYCSGIENYSRHFDGRPPGAKPYTLFDYFPKDDWLMVIDESHVTLPQTHAMYHGDKHRKDTLVSHGFRLPSALDNRPMRFEEIENSWPQVIFVTATPAPYELEKTEGEIVEQIIRPTGLVDPEIEIRPAAGQVPDLLVAARERIEKNERVLVTTLTKRLAEDLASYLADQGIRTRYLHSDIETLDRVTLLRELREGEYDVLVGVNLLREGLDLPEVSLVAIMDADKTGFLRSARSLIQQMGRAARNVNSKVLLYADSVTPAMQEAIDETSRRRAIQTAFNVEHGITPATVKKAIRRGIEHELRAYQTVRAAIGKEDEETFDRDQLLADMEKQMLKAAEGLEFERAASLRDQIKELKESPEGGRVTKGQTSRRKPKPGTPGTRVMRKKKGSS